MKKIVKPLIIIILTAVAIFGIVWAVLSIITGRGVLNLTGIGDTITPADSDVSDDELIDYVERIVTAVKSKNYEAVASVVHPDYGVIFSPYATVSLSTDKCFTQMQVAAFAGDTKKYIWGVYDGSGEPIEMTPAEYFDRFVYDTDFINCKNYGIDEVLRTGNSLENVNEVFTDARYVDCYMPDPKGESEPDWRSLRFVFEEYSGKLLLTAIIHSEYTI